MSCGACPSRRQTVDEAERNSKGCGKLVDDLAKNLRAAEPAGGDAPSQTATGQGMSPDGSGAFPGKCGAEDARCSEEACPDADLYSTGDLARECGITVRTVRFYEEAGLIAPLARSGGAHRLFTQAELAKLRLITDLREAGFAISDIKDLFELKKHCESAQQATKKMSSILEARIESIQHKIASLRRLRDEMAAMQAALRECQSCEAPDFVERCGECDVTNQPSVPRAMKLLWGNDE